MYLRESEYDVPQTSAATSIETRTRRGMAARDGADLTCTVSRRA